MRDSTHGKECEAIGVESNVVNTKGGAPEHDDRDDELGYTQGEDPDGEGETGFSCRHCCLYFLLSSFMYWCT